jgi:four helix bundle protein
VASEFSPTKGVTPMRPYFDHEKLEVYQAARAFNREVARLLEEIPRGHADSKDQLKRGAKSIPRNIAEGGGKWKLADKVHFYHIARGSATECAASLDELVDYGLVPESRIEAPKQTLARVVAMLINMIRSLEARGATDMTPVRVRVPVPDP